MGGRKETNCFSCTLRAIQRSLPPPSLLLALYISFSSPRWYSLNVYFVSLVPEQRQSASITSLSPPFALKKTAKTKSFWEDKGFQKGGSGRARRRTIKWPDML